jgi:hypothetical protein
MLATSPYHLGFPVRLLAALVAIVCAWLEFRALRNGWRLVKAQVRAEFGE